MLSSTNGQRTDPTILVIGVLVLVLALGFGVLAGVSGWLPFATLAAGLAGLLVLYRPYIGLLVLVATIPVENAAALSGDLTLGKLMGIMVFGSWLVRKVVRRESWKHLVTNPLFVLASLFACLVLASVLWAEDPLVARTGFISLSQMVALTIIIVDLVNTRRRLDILIKVLLIASAVAIGLTLHQSYILGVRRAGVDIAGGINSTAVLFVSVVPLCFYLFRAESRIGWRVLGLILIPASILAVIATYSRFNLLLLPPLILLFAILSLRERRSRGWLLGLAGAMTVAAVFYVPWDQLQRRAETITPYLEQTMQFGQERQQTSPRGYHLRVGLAIMRDNPVLGVGYGNYGLYFTDEYQFQVSGADRLYRSRRSPHSSYIGIAADLGGVGLVLWGGLFLACGLAIWRAMRLSRRAGDPTLFALIQAIGAMLLLQLAYGWYMPQQREKLFWLVVAMCGVLVPIITQALRPADEEGQDRADMEEQGPRARVAVHRRSIA